MFLAHLSVKMLLTQQLRCCRETARCFMHYTMSSGINLPNCHSIKSEIYFQLRVSWRHLCRNVEIYQHTTFRWDISIYGWVITTSGFWKQTSVILEFYFWVSFWLLYHRQHVILHRPTTFHPNQTTHGGLMTSYPFLRWRPAAAILKMDMTRRPAAMLDVMWVILHYPRNAIVGPSWVFKCETDRTYSFGDIAILIFWHFVLKRPIHVVIDAAHAQHLRQIYFPDSNYKYIWIWGRLAYTTSHFKRRISSNKGRLLVKSSTQRPFWAKIFQIPSKIVPQITVF